MVTWPSLAQVRCPPKGLWKLCLCLLILLPAILNYSAASSPEGIPSGDWRSEHGRLHPLTGRIWSTAETRFVSPEELLAAAMGTDFVLLGEVHDNEDHHRLQAWFVRSLALRGRNPAVAFEMISFDQGQDLAEYLRDNPRDAAGLGEALRWEQRGWPGWSTYQPIAQAVMDAGLRIVPANLSHEDKALIRKHGLDGLDAGTRSALALDRSLPAGSKGALEDQLQSSHCGLLLSASAVNRMVAMQRSRDAAMAKSLIEAVEAGTEGALLIAGMGHVRKDWGVPWYLSERQPQAKVLTIAFQEVVDGLSEPSAYHGSDANPRFDYLWFTPRGDDHDPCESVTE